MKKFAVIALVFALGLSIAAVDAHAGSAAKNARDLALLGIGAAIVGGAVMATHLAPAWGVEVHYGPPRVVHGPGVWVAPVIHKVWIPGRYGPRGHWIPGHWERRVARPGYWKKPHPHHGYYRHHSGAGHYRYKNEKHHGKHHGAYRRHTPGGGYHQRQYNRNDNHYRKHNGYRW